MTNTSAKTRTITQVGLLTAVIFVLGYLPRIAPSINWTLATIPVVIGAIIIGPAAGAALGAFWGLTSFFQVFGILGMPADPSGPLLFSISPILTIILCFVPRILVGFICAWIFRGLKKIDKTNFICYLVTNISGALLNTVLFLSALVLFFWSSSAFKEIREQYSSAFSSVLAIASVNMLAEVLSCAIIGTAVSKGVDIGINKSKRG